MSTRSPELTGKDYHQDRNAALRFGFRLWRVAASITMIPHVKLQRFLCPLVLVTFLVSGFTQEDYPRRPAVECTTRSGLPNFAAKLEAGKPVKIAYLGGSITAASGWRVQSREWFQEQYPDAQIEEIHAAIGGTGSDLGVFRLQNDVLRHKPDLLFVEFAVNDGGAPPERIHKAMEGIVRQTWKADPTIDICYVYTLSLPVLPELKAGKMQRSASAMEELADLYEIPSIHFGVKVAELETSGDLIFKAEKPENVAAAKPMVFSSDGVHPFSETGHVLYTKAIARSWPKIRDVDTQPGPHSLPAPLREDNWEAAKQVAITPEMLEGDWEKLPADHPIASRFARNMPEMYQLKSPGSALVFTFKGTTASVFDVVGPDGGALEIQLDEGAPKTQKRIDGYCTYHRMSKVTIATEIEPGVHEVRVTLTPQELDKREILFEKNRDFYDKHPERYEDHVWYFSSLLVIGDVE